MWNVDRGINNILGKKKPVRRKAPVKRKTPVRRKTPMRKMKRRAMTREDWQNLAEENEEKAERQFEEYLRSPAALRNKDENIRAMARLERQRDADKEVHVMLQGRNSYINFEKIEEQYPVKTIDEYNESPYSLNQKVVRAKVVYKDKWTGNKVDEEEPWSV
jgi:hypothetical protein